MNKTELIKAIASKTGKSQGDVKMVIDSALNMVVSALTDSEDGRVSISDFGTLSVVNKPARRFHNIKTGTTDVSEAYSSVKFQPAQRLKDIIK